jgi:glycosyltransferase involved in cell wall biosynthesis
MTLVLVGVPTHRRPRLLRNCLQSIAVQEGRLPSIRVFVADNDASAGDGFKIADQLRSTYPYELDAVVVPEAGISAVRNAILDEARRAGADCIAMIDDDETAQRNWLAKLLEAQEEYSSDVVAGPVVYEFESGGSVRAAFWTDRRESGPTSVIYATNNFLISCAALARMGWPSLDPAFGLTGGGDFEWFTRMKNLGATFAWAADALVSEFVPRERQSLRWFLLRQYKIGGNDVRVARLQGTRSQFAMFLLKALGALVVSPFLVAVAPNSDARAKALRRWVRATGRLGELFGLRYREYARGHRPRG